MLKSVETLDKQEAKPHLNLKLTNHNMHTMPSHTYCLIADIKDTEHLRCWLGLTVLKQHDVFTTPTFTLKSVVGNFINVTVYILPAEDVKDVLDTLVVDLKLSFRYNGSLRIVTDRSAFNYVY